MTLNSFKEVKVLYQDSATKHFKSKKKAGVFVSFAFSGGPGWYCLTVIDKLSDFLMKTFKM